MVRPLTGDVSSHELAGTQQQGTDGASMRVQIYVREFIRLTARHALGRFEGASQFTMEGESSLGGQRLGDVPEQFMELAHDGECVEHLAGDVRGLSPVLPAEGALRHPLASAKAVVYRTATKAALPEVRMDAAPEGRLQVGTGLPGRLGDREVGGSRERRCRAAERKALLAVGPECVVLARAGQCGPPCR
jgi:hypothetical protein